MRLNGINRIRLMPVDALGNPTGDVFDLTDNLETVPILRVTFVDENGKPIPNFGKPIESGAIDLNNVGYDIWLIAGDQNTKSGVGTNDDIDYPDSRILQYSQYGANVDNLILAKEPLQHFDYASGKIGFAFTFAKWYAMTIPNNRKVVLIPYGKNNSGFVSNDWNPSNTLHLDVISTVNTVLELPGKNKFCGVLWHSGLSDTSMSKADYIQALDNCFISFRNNINNAKNCFLLVGELPRPWVNNSDKEAIQEAIQETPNRFFYSGCASSENLAVESNGTDFTAVSQRILGRRYFDAYIYAVSNTQSAPQPPINIQFDPTSVNCKVSWSGLSQYWVYQYKTKPGLTWNPENISLVNSITLNGLSPNTTYQFRVKAANNSGESTFTTEEFNTLLGEYVPDPLLKLNFNLGITNNSGTGNYTITVIPPNVNDVYRVYDDPIRPNVIHIGGGGSGIEIDMALPSSYTKALWFKQKNSFNPNIFILGSYNSPDNILWSPGTDLVFAAGHDGDWNLIQDNETHLVGVWYHLAVTYDNSSKRIKFFKNGIKVNEAILANSFSGSPSPLRVGKYTDAIANNAPGYYDDVMIWDEALSESQVYQVYLDGLI